MSKQTLDKHGQPILGDRRCHHGVFCDDRGNNACEQCSENNRTGGFLLGISSGWDEVHDWARKKSGEEYSVGHDERARFFRDLAKFAKDTSEERRTKYDEHERDYRHGFADKKAS